MSWLHDTAVEIGDIIDTPDFMTNPDENENTIRVVEEILVKALIQQFSVTYTSTGDREYAVSCAGVHLGNVFSSRSGATKRWGYTSGRYRERNGFDTRRDAAAGLVWELFNATLPDVTPVEDER